jgi:hypothetical protein
MCKIIQKLILLHVISTLNLFVFCPLVLCIQHRLLNLEFSLRVRILEYKFKMLFVIYYYKMKTCVSFFAAQQFGREAGVMIILSHVVLSYVRIY